MHRSSSLRRAFCAAWLVAVVASIEGCGGSNQTAPVPTIQVQGVLPTPPKDSKQGERRGGSESARDPALGPGS